MASKDEHLSKARENQAFAESLINNSRAEREWGLIIRFYSAVHYIEAYLASVGCGASTHSERRRAVGGRRELAAIARPFNELYNLAWNARYLCLDCPLADVLRAHEILIAIRAHVEELI
ncbi:MAG: hypothetical protein ACLP59_14015 [Bryobacteraceae bacterium]